MSLSRRQMLRFGGGVSLGAAFAGLALRRALAGEKRSSHLHRSGDGVFELPPGFKSVLLDEVGRPMDDGYLVPGRPDGMACFVGDGDELILMRNHEVDRLDLAKSPFRSTKLPDDKTYDRLAGGGVTRLVIDRKDGRVRRRNLVLAGTARNCSGGKSPWGWLSCEESLEPNHGYVFLCDPKATTVQAPVRIDGYGRFNHEAAAVDPATFMAFMTEDQDDGCLYRFVPDSKSEPFKGHIEALKIAGHPRFETGSRRLTVGAGWGVEWVPVKEVDAKGDTLRTEAHAVGAALFERGEGLWLEGTDVYVSATTGGPKGRGQIWRLRDATGSKGRLELVATAGDTELDMPDGITVAPWGDLFVAEDGEGGNSLRLVKPNGTVRTFANCIRAESELTGICFDPAGDRLFVNAQSAGLTMMITGPFKTWCA